jgi:hypothetical protein
VVPLISRIASALGNWLGDSFGGNLRLVPDLDEVPALSIEREALWKRVGEASFLTDDEKRAAAGYEPLPSSFAPSSAATLLAKYDPNQPRVPAGNSDGGQWTSGGAEFSDSTGEEESEANTELPIIHIAGRGGIPRAAWKLTVREFASRFCRGVINREIPSQFEDMTIGDMIEIAKGGDAAARKCYKLLNEPRFRK